MRAVWGLPAAGLLLAGCLSGGGTTVDDCTSSYRRVAHAPRLGALKGDLTNHVPPSRRSIDVADHHGGKRTINVLDRRGRPIMSVDVWRLPDDSWTARKWRQCID